MQLYQLIFGLPGAQVSVPLLLLMLAIMGCANPSSFPQNTAEHHPADEAARLVAQLDNTDVKWHGTYVGLVPEISGAAAERLIEIGPAAHEALISALADPRRFAAAHVILTMMSHEEFKSSGSVWNGLRVELMADGGAIVHPEQRAELQRQWKAKADAVRTPAAKASSPPPLR